MNWPKEYLRQIRAGEEVVCNKIRTVYERECGWMDNPPDDFPFYFDEVEGEAHIDFIETFCKHSKGKWAGKPVVLEVFQKAKIQLVFGWCEKETGLRRIQEVIDIRGRKCGKSTETAAVEWDVALNDGEAGAEIYCVANKKEQAEIIFTEVSNMRAQSPALRAISKKRRSDIYIAAMLSVIKVLSADYSTMDGLNTHFFVQDEWHEAKTSKIYDVLIQSQSAREQPLAWLISTNGFQREGFYDSKYNYASKVALWQEGFEDYSVLALIHELDSREEWTDPGCWGKANPGLGKIKSIKMLEKYVEKAKRDPDFLPTVLTKDFNIPENTAKSWLSFEEAKNDAVAEIGYLEKSYAIGGCDLSSTTDLTCATLLIRKPGDDCFYVLQQYFLPKTKVKTVAEMKQGEAPYQKWADQGWVTICDGATVDFHQVTEWFAEMVRRHNIRPLWIGYDAALSGYWREEMDSYGFEMEKIRQGPFTWTYPMKRLKGIFEEHRMVYQKNPVLRWCLLNTGVKSLNKDGIESQQPVKGSSIDRIDGMVSLLNAMTCYNNHEEEYLKYVR
ncbi:Phage terminase-like protein, large subunit, contains N-terminal HTH domain [Eubacterium aggregans]|uniref:Phage terminase-like protein, large subunit, contains N-terminal HTH domain n=1 Tax=Eubacterium aggregans TaxID=81409 RepID=A0A1H4BNS6_9FIRM|nr:terminase TerL endonuclease subunit [Eubacterium aggregans]SEA49714.1 Phage terminase-like protein, large subunit, contains N-terminal HTH domain [Eubacterium aggregans]